MKYGDTAYCSGCGQPWEECRPNGENHCQGNDTSWLCEQGEWHEGEELCDCPVGWTCRCGEDNYDDEDTCPSCEGDKP